MNKGTLDEQLACLKGIGTKEINKATKLTTNKIEDILEKRFDKIDRIRAKGFINILEREYNLNLSGWLNEYAIFHNKENPHISAPTSQSPISEIDIRTHIKEYNRQNTNPRELVDSPQITEPYNKSIKAKKASNNPLPFALLILLALCCAGYLAYRVFFAETTMPTDYSHSTQSLPVEFMTDSLEMDLKDYIQDKPSLQDGTLDTHYPLSQAPRLAIVPKSELWIGIIEVQTQKTTQLNITQTYEITLDKPLIVVFGHNDFTSILNDETFPHKINSFVRFYFDGQQLKEINYSTYKQLYPIDQWGN